MDKDRARELYLEAAQRGNARAQCNLGFFYYHGITVEEDGVKAAQWFAKAADQSYHRAEFLLGECYEAGCGVEKIWKRR